MQSKEKKEEDKRRDEGKNIKDGGFEGRTKNCKARFNGSSKRKGEINRGNPTTQRESDNKWRWIKGTRRNDQTDNRNFEEITMWERSNRSKESDGNLNDDQIEGRTQRIRKKRSKKRGG